MAASRGWGQPLPYAVVAAAVTAAAIWLAYAFGPAAPLVALGALGLAAIAMASPLATLTVAVALVPLEVVSLEIGGGAGLSPAEGAFVLAGVGWAVRRLAAGLLPVVASPLTKPLAALLVVAVAGLGVAQDTGVTLKIVLMWTAAFLVVQAIIAEGTPETVGRILLVLAVTGGVVGVVAAATAAGQPQDVAGIGTQVAGRAEASFGQPNMLAVFLAVALASAVAVAVGGRVRERPVAAVAFAGALAGLALTLSRGGLLAAAAAIAVMLLWRPFRRIAGVAAVVTVIALLFGGGDILGNSESVDRVTKRIESVQYAAQGADPRADLWRRTPRVIADHPLVGVGAGQFPVVAGRYGLRDPLSDHQPFQHAHNIPLTVAAELGILGLAALLWLALALLAVVVRACRRTSGRERAYAFGVAAALLAVAVQGLVDYTVRSNVIAMLVLALAAAAVVLSRTGDRAPGSQGI